MEHFGVKIIKVKYSFNLVREEFALVNTKISLDPTIAGLVKMNAYVDSSYSEYSEEWCNSYREVCLRNYDQNMEYFSTLDENLFNKTLNNFLRTHRHFNEIKDLNLLSQKSGYYVMVLDEYKQVYIGKSVDMKKRIRQHWTSTKAFDRTLLPLYNEKSVFSIDFFRCLDTTRIFAWHIDLSDGIEATLVRDFSKSFCLNRIGGDVTDGINAILTMNVREFPE